MSVINFYSVSDEYGCFSNFWPHPITLRGKTWPTSEHYFQSQKFAGTENSGPRKLDHRLSYSGGPAKGV